jgi:hypothetical protein
MTVGRLVDTVFRFNRLCECHLYTAPRNKVMLGISGWVFPSLINEISLEVEFHSERR